MTNTAIGHISSDVLEHLPVPAAIPDEEMRYVYVNINGIIKDAILISQHQWQDIARLKITPDPKMPEFLGYADQLEQAFLILIMNVIHTIKNRTSQELEKITITTQRAKEHIEIHVRDNEAGITQQNMEKTYTPDYSGNFYKLGIGQGLNTAKKIVAETHAGQIFCSSEIDRSTCFTVCLPRRSTR